MPSNILGLDVGEKRVGIALVRAEVRVAVPLTTLLRSEADFWQQLQELKQEYDIGEFVIGLPRNLNGQDTEQTQSVRLFADELKEHINLPMYWQDEALTSIKAESILKQSGKAYEKGDIDMVSASLILSDFIEAERMVA